MYLLLRPRHFAHKTEKTKQRHRNTHFSKLACAKFWFVTNLIFSEKQAQFLFILQISDFLSKIWQFAYELCIFERKFETSQNKQKLWLFLWKKSSGCESRFSTTREKENVIFLKKHRKFMICTDRSQRGPESELVASKTCTKV